MLEPELLLIDELSLGLAPVVVQELLVVVERLKDQGVTMVIVEQSVNVALSVADRAVFMERGRVRFEGPAQELLERGDLLRAVFLSGEGA
jgi:ABC-type branched-subunit amino acid transport system ATPase component